MKFNGFSIADLGIDFHTTSDLVDSEGRPVERYVLCNKLTSEQEAQLSKYENIKISKDGATYRYAPEQKYDVVYITRDSDGEATEDFEDEHIGKSTEFDEWDDSSEVVDQLDQEIESMDKFTQLSGLVSQLDSLIIFSKTLSEMFPESKPDFDNLVSDLSKHLEVFQPLKSNQLEQQPDYIREGEVL